MGCPYRVIDLQDNKKSWREWFEFEIQTYKLNLQTITSIKCHVTSNYYSRKRDVKDDKKKW